MNDKIQNAKRLLRKVKRGKSKSKMTDKQSDFLSEKKFLIQRSDDFSEKVKSNVVTDLNDLRHEIGSLEIHLSGYQKLLYHRCAYTHD